MCNMPNFEAIVIKTNLEFCTSIKVIRDQIMVMRGSMIQNSKEVVTYPSVCMFLLYVLKCYVLRSSEVKEVNEGQPESVLLPQTLPYFLCKTAVLSFYLIFNMPIFLVIVKLTTIQVWRSLKVIKGQFRVMRGHMIQKSKKFVTYNVMRSSGFF